MAHPRQIRQSRQCIHQWQATLAGSHHIHPEMQSDHHIIYIQGSLRVHRSIIMEILDGHGFHL